MNTLIVVVLVIVIAVMAWWIKELIYHKRSDSNRMAYLTEINHKTDSALFAIQKLLNIEAGGIYKRISENREILEHLNEYDCKALSETNLFWLIDAHHQFLLSLVYEMKSQDSEFEMYSGCHRIDDIEIFKLVGEKLGESPFVIERLSQLKKEEDKMNENN